MALLCLPMLTSAQVSTHGNTYLPQDYTTLFRELDRITAVSISALLPRGMEDISEIFIARADDLKEGYRAVIEYDGDALSLDIHMELLNF